MPLRFGGGGPRGPLNLRKLACLPPALLGSGRSRWAEAEAVLASLPFAAAKCAGGMLDDYIAELAQLIAARPGEEGSGMVFSGGSGGGVGGGGLYGSMGGLGGGQGEEEEEAGGGGGGCGGLGGGFHPHPHPHVLPLPLMHGGMMGGPLHHGGMMGGMMGMAGMMMGGGMYPGGMMMPDMSMMGMNPHMQGMAHAPMGHNPLQHK